jgi:hypothetical protein
MTDPTMSGAPGAESHVPGQDSNEAGAAGVAPGGTSLEAATGPDAPSEDVLNASGDSMGDDDVIPQAGMNDAGEVLPDGDSSVTSTSASEPPD